MAWHGVTRRDGWMTSGAICRAGHATAWDEERGGMWLHGGYTTFFPYISSDGAGSDSGTTVGHFSCRERERKREKAREREKALESCKNVLYTDRSTHKFLSCPFFVSDRLRDVAKPSRDLPESEEMVERTGPQRWSDRPL